jgi:6-phosphofructokinase
MVKQPKTTKGSDDPPHLVRMLKVLHWRFGHIQRGQRPSRTLEQLAAALGQQVSKLKRAWRVGYTAGPPPVFDEEAVRKLKWGRGRPLNAISGCTHAELNWLCCRGTLQR